MLRIEFPSKSNHFIVPPPQRLADLLIDGLVTPQTAAQRFVAPVVGSARYIWESGVLQDHLGIEHYDLLSIRVLERVHALFDPPERAWQPVNSQSRKGKMGLGRRSGGFVSSLSSRSTLGNNGEPDYLKYDLLADLRPQESRGSVSLMGLEWLETRVEHMADQWDWSRCKGLEFRLRWLAAWLAELSGRYEIAIARYTKLLSSQLKVDKEEKRLLCSEPDPQLWQLAYNNLAVLILRTGPGADSSLRETALDLLVRLAVWEMLPAACLSLSNLIDLNWAKRSEELFKIDKLIDANVGKLREIAEKGQQRSRGGKSAGQQSLPAQAAGRWELLVRGSRGGDKPFGEFRTDHAAIDIRLHRRIRSVIAPLLLVAIEAGPKDWFGSGNVLRETETLVLWDRPNHLLWKAPPQPKKVPNIVERHKPYSGAASILYPRDVFAQRVGSGGPQSADMAAGVPVGGAAQAIERMIQQGRFQEAESMLSQLEAQP